MLIKSCFIFSLLCVVYCSKQSSLDIDTDRHWYQYKTVFNKTFSKKEENYRRNVFVDNLNRIVKHNIEADLGLHSYKLGVNQFAAMTNEEFSIFYKGFDVNRKKASSLVHTRSSVKLPDTVDWRQKGLVTGVKNQKHCGSCWAFSAVASIEGQHAKATGKLVSLSEQQLVDCSSAYDNNGCEGGLMVNAFKYVIANGGIDTEESYPYEAKDDNCRFNKETIGATISSYKNVSIGDEDALQDAVANVGPISVGIDASSIEFQFYKNGVYDDPNCGQDLDHGVTAVGYGTDESSGKDYWLVKNSWGESWGDEGYIKMSRNKNDQCGIALAASYPIL